MTFSGQKINNVAVFTKFFEENFKTLRNYLYYKYGDSNQASDVAQEAFIKLWQNANQVSLEKAKSFLYTVANNATLNQIAHQKVVLNFANKKQNNHFAESPEFILEEKEFDKKLQNAIAKLPEKNRTCFLLNRIDGKKYKEIAEILDINIKTVEKRISAALQDLKIELENFK
jgi:RNA polymerase sigma-70 factor (family 1)